MVALVGVGWLGACTCSDQPTPAPATPVVAEPSAPAAAPADEKAAPPALSEEDLRLLAADPATLSPEERRKRAYALRRKIMQNPDSPTARMLEDLRRAHEAGELEVQKPGEGAHFEARGSGPPKDGPPPAGTRPPAGSDPAPASGAP